MNPKLEITIHILIIIVLIFLILYMIDDSYNYDCANCVVSFQSDLVAHPGTPKRDYITIINVSGIDLYNNLSNGDCVVIWDVVEGYRRK